ncbi:hypothetical protein CIB84_007566, partial [Bambusicola thoracicus]
NLEKQIAADFAKRRTVPLLLVSKGLGNGREETGWISANLSEIDGEIPGPRESGETKIITNISPFFSTAGSVHSPSTSMATSAQYRQLINDYGPPSLGYTQGIQGTSSSQVPQSKYAELLAIIEELGKEIRPTYAGSKSAMERLKRGNVENTCIIHARGLVRECLAETERNARS